VESRESLRASRLSTPYPAAIPVHQKPRYTNNTNNSTGTKDRAGQPTQARL